jgi:hypothetical protein
MFIYLRMFWMQNLCSGLGYLLDIRATTTYIVCHPGQDTASINMFSFVTF